LPPPTELFIAVAKTVRSPVASVALGLWFLAMAALSLRGSFDQFLRMLVVGNVIGLVLLIGFYVQSLILPLIKIQEVLKDR
jgi:hypothetical protein